MKCRGNYTTTWMNFWIKSRGHAPLFCKLNHRYASSFSSQKRDAQKKVRPCKNFAPTFLKKVKVFSKKVLVFLKANFGRTKKGFLPWTACITLGTRGGA